MNECYFRKYLINDEIKDCTEFDNSLIKNSLSVYEVLRYVQNVPVFLSHHYQRLIKTAALVGIDFCLTEKQIRKKIEKLAEINQVSEGVLKLVFCFGKNCKEHTSFTYFIKPMRITAADFENGVAVEPYYAERQNPNAKVINLDFRNTMEHEIQQRAINELLLINNEGYLTEGSRSNIFFISGNELVTPPVEKVLPGISRKFVFKICKSLNYKIIERNILYSEINNFQSAFLTGTSRKVLPIKRIENNLYDVNNKILRKIMHEFNEEIRKEIEANSSVL